MARNLNNEDPPLTLPLGLMPYATILRQAQVFNAGGAVQIQFNEADLKQILRRFLRLIPFDDDSYLAANPECAAAAASGGYNGSPRSHFTDHGFFEGRKPFPEFDPIDGGASDQELPLPRSEDVV